MTDAMAIANEWAEAYWDALNTPDGKLGILNDKQRAIMDKIAQTNPSTPAAVLAGVVIRLMLNHGQHNNECCYSLCRHGELYFQ